MACIVDCLFNLFKNNNTSSNTNTHAGSNGNGNNNGNGNGSANGNANQNHSSHYTATQIQVAALPVNGSPTQTVIGTQSRSHAKPRHSVSSIPNKPNSEISVLIVDGLGTQFKYSPTLIKILLELSFHQESIYLYLNPNNAYEVCKKQKYDIIFIGTKIGVQVGEDHIREVDPILLAERLRNTPKNRDSCICVVNQGTEDIKISEEDRNINAMFNANFSKEDVTVALDKFKHKIPVSDVETPYASGRGSARERSSRISM